MQNNIEKFVEICNATYDEVWECLGFANELVRSELHGMIFMKRIFDELKLRHSPENKSKLHQS